MSVKYEKGSKFTVVDTSGHCFAMGSIVTLDRDHDDEGYVHFDGVSKNFGHNCGQALSMDQVVPLVVVEPTTKTTGEVSPKQSRVNYLYVVEDEDGAYVKTFDRGYAREVKAELGGKKAGVIITAYAAVKEIR